MLSSNPIIRRYTPPTCTLEIWAENSPLSNLMDKEVLQELNFKLQFDDPRLPEERKVFIRGDKEQLEILCNVVTSYVQQLLQQSAEDFGTTLSDPESHAEQVNIESEPEAEPEIKDVNNVNTGGFSPPNISSFNTQVPHNKPNNQPNNNIYVEPGENLTHKLFFGDLANPISGLSVELTLLQLFDLATALDEYSSDVITLPSARRKTSRNSLPSWGPIAAVLVIGVGLAPFTWQYVSNSKANQQVAKTTPENTEIPLTNSPNIDSNISQSQPNNLLPNGVNPSALPTNVPVPPIAALPQTGSNISLNAPQSNVPVNPQYPLTANVPNSQPQSQLNIPLGGQNTMRIGNNPTGKTATSNNNNSSTFSTLPRSIVSVPNSNFDSSKLNKIADPIPSFSPAALPQQDVTINNTTNTNNPTTTNNITTNVPENSPNVSQPKSEKTLVARLREASKTSSNSSSSSTSSISGNSGTTNSNNQTLFDTPQIAEAREYLQKNWNPPAGLSDTLEYSLMLGVDGKIEKILPLNKPAREYIDNTGIPEIGKPFVSTNKSGQSVKVRVVLGADGKVQTFPE